MTADDFKRQLEALGAEYRRDLPQKLAQIDDLWLALSSGAARPERIADLLRALHSLAGSARTFGVAGVSEAAAAAESFLEPFSKQRKMPEPAKRAQFMELLNALRLAAA